MFQKLVILFNSIILFSCVGATQQKDNTSNELLQRELETQNKAKYGKDIPPIKVVTDAKRIAEIRTTLQNNIATKKEKQALDESQNFTISKRYKKGDKIVVPEILKILQGNDKAARTIIYEELAKDYDDPESYEINEPELVAQLLKGIESPEDEEAAIQLAGITKLRGANERFEKRLLSGKSIEEGRIVFWLSHEGKSLNAINYIDKKIRAKKLPSKELDQAINGLEGYASSTDNIIKRKVGDLALFIYKNKLIVNERFEDLKNSAHTSDAAESLLICLFVCGDESVIPIAKDILKRNIRFEKPVEALIRLEGSKHLNKVYGYLSSEDKFYTGLSIVEELDKKFVTDSLLRQVLIEKSKDKDINEMDINRIIELYKKNDAEQYIKNPLLVISDKLLADSIVDSYKFSLTTSEAILKDLLDLKIITIRPSDDVIKKIEKETKNAPTFFAMEVMEKQNVLISFDTETDFVPVNYDGLFEKFASKTNGAFKDVLFYMETKESENNFKYTITIVTNKSAYITIFADDEDWYNMALVENLLERILKDINSENKFVPVTTGDQNSMYIFGDPKNVNLFLKKYKL